MACSASWADPSPALDRFSLSAGGFYADPRIQLDADTSSGRLTTPEHNGDKTTVPRLRGEMLIGDHNGISADYYRYDKAYGTSLSGATVINGQPVSGNASLNADMRLEVGQLAYRWWFGSGNDVLGLGLGAAYYRAKLSGTATGTVGGATATGSDAVSADAVAPLLELAWRHAFTPDFRLYTEASGVKKSGGNINGHIYGGTIGLEWFPAKAIGVGVDYGITKIRLNRDNDSANLNVRLTGPSAYMKVRF
ncbi:OprO/OprP family phosphate-selective porin [Undibacterium terreum]|uniref:Outer membrane protein beta-barrel domain-containing protein n=1 Tax=Undibacterium terreum TaxID=1224302 RepID=A0A916UBN6_9BURK|nr:OprO/OprP family phosphate-selective porin [Undibacterium terreum]GGC67127.1 hypothetical protein GCM10011396_12650 [Undibacterium terreum]